MTQPDVVRVEPQRLRDVAAAIAETAAMVNGAASQHKLPPITPGAGAGWDTMTALRLASETWGRMLSGLGASISDLADGMKSAADSYVASDSAGSHRLGDRFIQ